MFFPGVKDLTYFFYNFDCRKPQYGLVAVVQDQLLATRSYACVYLYCVYSIHISVKLSAQQKK